MKDMTEKINHLEDTAFSGWMGIAREDITPPTGIYNRNWGAAKRSVATGVHKPLQLNCLTLQKTLSEPLFVMITMDLGWWKGAADEKELRQAIINEFRLAESNLLICLSHTHAGPVIFSEDADKEGGEFIVPYLAVIKEKAIKSIQCALASRAVCTLSWQYGRCDLAANRDLPDPEGEGYLVGYHPGQSADDILLIGRVTDASKNIVGTIVNYACHPTTLAWENQLLSPDYIGAMREVIGSRTNNAPCLFLQGASGELAPKIQYTGDCEIADRHGRQLGYAVLSALESMPTPNMKPAYQHKLQSGAPLAIWKEERYEPSTILQSSMVWVDLPLKPLAALSDIEQQITACKDPVLKERLWRSRGIRITVGEGETFTTPIWIWRIGEVILAAQPNETYSDFQTIIREHFSNRKVAVLNMVNGYTGYLPPAEMYSRNQYAVWQTPFGSGSLEILTETTLRGISSLVTNDDLK